MAAMRVRVEINGHQTYKVVEGEALHWGSTVEHFDAQLFAVPCVVVRCDNGAVEVVPLKTQYTWPAVVAFDGKD